MRGREVWRTRALVLATVAAFALAGCGGDDGNGAGGAGSPEPAGEGNGGATADITISGFAFDPSTLEVDAGATITIVNEDDATHTFTADDGSFDEELGSGDSVEVTLDGASGDELGFHCEIHSSMTGSLVFS